MTSEREALAALLRELVRQEGDWGHLTAESLADLLLAAGVRLGSGPLDAAWAKVEAALPVDWKITRMQMVWEPYRREPLWYATAERFGAAGGAVGEGPTPAAALLALADRLTGATEPTPDRGEPT